MKILYSWLKDFINIELSPDELAKKLTLAGHEVETIEKWDEDFVFDLEITPNRGDCLSHLGIAREIFAICHSEGAKRPKNLNAKQDGILQPIRHRLQDDMKPKDDKLKINIADPNDCPKYIGRYITGVKVMPSSKWIQKRLKAMGVQPINNVVDATNYVLFEMGQPLHAFNAKTLSPLEIIVRRAESDEEIITLDQQKRKLDKDILVIADSKKPIAVAGIMGGLETGVTNKTTDIIIESAVFDPKFIRQGSKKLKLTTEASYRFERGVDYEGVERAMERVTELIINPAGGKIQSQISNVKSQNHISNVKTIKLDLRNVKRVLGITIASEEIKSILQSLGFEINDSKTLVTRYPLLVTVPSWRHDINIEEDLIEEVARIYGYDKISQISNIKSQNHILKLKTKKQEPSLYEKKEIIKDILADMGLQEVYNYSFIGEEDLTVTSDKQQVTRKSVWELENPLSPELKYMRSSLIPGLLRSVAKNPDFDPMEIFEIGNVFTKGEKEKTTLGICLAGGKTKIEDVIGKIKNESRITNHESRIMDIDRAILKHYKIRKSRIQVVEIDINDLVDKVKMPTKSYLIPASRSQYKEISKFPPATRDLAIVIDKNISSTTVIKMIKTTDTAVLIVELFDEYENPTKFGSNKKSLAFHIVYQNLNKTLSDSEADKIHGKIIKRAEKELRAELRR